MMLFLAACLFTPLSAQLKLGLRIGMSTTLLQTNEVEVPSPGGGSFLKLDIDQLHFGIHGGLVLQAQLGNFLIQPEVLFNSNRVDYRVDDLRGGNLASTIRTEKYQNLDIPFLLGFRARPFRFHAGPKARLFVDSSSELFDFPGYEQKFREAAFSWIAGLGLDVWNLMLDVRYEGNFSKFGDHITFNEQQYAFDKKPARLLVSVGLLFGK